MQGRRWVLSVVLYSAAVSIKMNVLLMAPGVLAVLIKVGAARCQLGSRDRQQADARALCAGKVCA